MKPGDRVYYFDGNKVENGVVKRIVDGRIFVVYRCGGDWENYQNYNGVLTPREKLFPGWMTKTQCLV